MHIFSIKFLLLHESSFQKASFQDTKTLAKTFIEAQLESFSKLLANFVSQSFQFETIKINLKHRWLVHRNTMSLWPPSCWWSQRAMSRIKFSCAQWWMLKWNKKKCRENVRFKRKSFEIHYFHSFLFLIFFRLKLANLEKKLLNKVLLAGGVNSASLK